MGSSYGLFLSFMSMSLLAVPDCPYVKENCFCSDREVVLGHKTISHGQFPHRLYRLSRLSRYPAFPRRARGPGPAGGSAADLYRQYPLGNDPAGAEHARGGYLWRSWKLVCQGTGETGHPAGPDLPHLPGIAPILFYGFPLFSRRLFRARRLRQKRRKPLPPGQSIPAGSARPALYVRDPAIDLLLCRRGMGYLRRFLRRLPTLYSSWPRPVRLGTSLVLCGIAPFLHRLCRLAFAFTPGRRPRPTQNFSTHVRPDRPDRCHRHRHLPRPRLLAHGYFLL